MGCRGRESPENSRTTKSRVEFSVSTRLFVYFWLDSLSKRVSVDQYLLHPAYVVNSHNQLPHSFRSQQGSVCCTRFSPRGAMAEGSPQVAHEFGTRKAQRG
jgi:hypothetical protein